MTKKQVDLAKSILEDIIEVMNQIEVWENAIGFDAVSFTTKGGCVSQYPVDVKYLLFEQIRSTALTRLRYKLNDLKKGFELCKIDIDGSN